MDGPPHVEHHDVELYQNIWGMYNDIETAAENQKKTPFDILRDNRLENNDPNVSYSLQVTIEDGERELEMIVEDHTDVMRHIREMENLDSDTINTKWLAPNAVTAVRFTMLTTRRYQGPVRDTDSPLTLEVNFGDRSVKSTIVS